MTRHPGSVEFDHSPKKREDTPLVDPLDRKAEESVEGIGMEKQDSAQVEDEMAGASEKDETA